MIARATAFFFERNPLLIPADGFGFFDESSYHTRKGARFLRKLPGRLVILISTHINLPVSARCGFFPAGLKICRSCAQSLAYLFGRTDELIVQIFLPPVRPTETKSGFRGLTHLIHRFVRHGFSPARKREGGLQGL
jgi:hypothetical protein